MMPKARKSENSVNAKGIDKRTKQQRTGYKYSNGLGIKVRNYTNRPWKK